MITCYISIKIVYNRIHVRVVVSATLTNLIILSSGTVYLWESQALRAVLLPPYHHAWHRDAQTPDLHLWLWCKLQWVVGRGRISGVNNSIKVNGCVCYATIKSLPVSLVDSMHRCHLEPREVVTNWLCTICRWSIAWTLYKGWSAEKGIIYLYRSIIATQPQGMCAEKFTKLWQWHVLLHVATGVN